MSVWVRLGAKCVLVDPNPRWNEISWVRVPVKGVEYTVGDIVKCDGLLAIRLVELPNTFVFKISSAPFILGPAVFGVRRFRPLVPLASDVALFAHLLDRVGEPA